MVTVGCFRLGQVRIRLSRFGTAMSHHTIACHADDRINLAEAMTCEGFFV